MVELYWSLLGCLGSLVLIAIWQLLRHSTTPTRPHRLHRSRRRRVEPRPVHRIELGETRSIEELSESLGNELASLSSSVEGHAQLLCEALGQPAVVAEQAEQLWESVRRLRFFSEKLQSAARIPQLEMEATNIGQLLAALVMEIEDYSRGSLQVSLSIAPSLPFAIANPGALRTAMLFLVEGVLELEPDASTLLLQAQSQESKDETVAVRIDIEAVLEDATEGRAKSLPAIQFSYLAARNLLHSQVANFSLDHTPGLNAVASITLEATHDASQTVEADMRPREVVHRGAAVAVPEGEAEPHKFGGILIMEGNPMIRDLLARELRQTNRNIIACADGIAARSLFEATPERFELFILEQESRRLRGEELAKQALAANRDLQILLITPGPGAVIEASLSTHPQLRVLHKPFGLMELRDALTELLGPEPRVEPASRRPIASAR